MLAFREAEKIVLIQLNHTCIGLNQINDIKTESESLGVLIFMKQILGRESVMLPLAWKRGINTHTKL